VLVFGEFILTAAHCIGWDSQVGMALGDWYVETVKTSIGEQFKLTPVIVEPVNDSAVRGEIDNQVFPKDADKFERFREEITPVAICQNVYQRGQSHEVYIMDLEGKWVGGTVKS
jgi:hypothetical protein